MEDEHGKAYERNVDPRSNLPNVMTINLKKITIMELKIVLHVNGHMIVRPS